MALAIPEALVAVIKEMLERLAHDEGKRTPCPIDSLISQSIGCDIRIFAFRISLM
jgi:hypothetical protein